MRHETDVQEAMRRFSEDTLDRLYFEILDNIRKAEAYSSKTAIRVFSLLLCLHEPLSPASFIAALTLMDGKHEAVLQLPQVLRICFNLITIDSRMNILRFAHTSVQEFLEAQTEFVPHKTDGIVATSCLNSCLYSFSVGLGAELSPTEHFYHYGVLYWAEHCKATFMAGNDPKLLRLAKEFMLDDEGISLSFIGWLEDAQEYAKVLPRHHSLKRKLLLSGVKTTHLFSLFVFLDWSICSTKCRKLPLLVGIERTTQDKPVFTSLAHLVNKALFASCWPMAQMLILAVVDLVLLCRQPALKAISTLYRC